MKLVKEHINFTRGLEPKESMGIGMTDENIMRNAEKILMDAFPYLNVSFHLLSNLINSHLGYMSGNPKLIADLQLAYTPKKEENPGFKLYDNDGERLFVPEEPLYEIQPIISVMHEYISKYGWWQDEKKYINDKYIQ